MFAEDPDSNNCLMALKFFIPVMASLHNEINVEKERHIIKIYIYKITDSINWHCFIPKM